MLPPGIEENLPPWALYIFYAAAAIGAAFVFVRGMKTGAKQGTETDAASRAITAVASVQAPAEKMTQEALVQSLAALKLSIDRLHARLDKEEMRDQVEKEMEMIELLRIAKQLKDKGHE